MTPMRRRRTLIVLVAFALVLTACSESVTVGTGIEGFEEFDPANKAAVEETMPVEEAVIPEAPASSAEVELASGRDALAAVTANGEPHILWFWGAN